MIALLKRSKSFAERTAIVSGGDSYSYRTLLESSNKVATHLLAGNPDLQEKPVAFLIPPSFEYTAVQWGIWSAGGIAVPLCMLHPLPALQYVLEDTGSEIVVAHPDYLQILQPLQQALGVTLLNVFDLLQGQEGVLPEVAPNRKAMILYTSGTTSKPKGVVTTHANIETQIRVLVEAWAWEKRDYILNVLPMHHVHGIINVMSCALWSGGCCEFMPKFDAAKVWEVIGSGRLTLFMAVPTIYYKLIAHWEQLESGEQKKLSEQAGKLRLMVSGSAALPVPVMDRWKSITGQTLLERYGMTEIGMALSNPYHGERRPGHVGQPLPGVEIRLADSAGRTITDDSPGEIQVKGAAVFLEYWGREKATKDAFTADGWFKTGDIARLNKGSYKILGRDSVDIIKSGGYKISALEIEDVLRKHPQISDCAVVGIPDETWGEVVSAFLVGNVPEISAEEVSEWAAQFLPAYQLPRKFVQLDELPRNVLGKVTKNVLREGGS